MLIIGIAGGSGSGKTTVVKAITEQLKDKVTVIQPNVQNGIPQSSISGVILTDVSGVVEQVMPTVVAITNSSYYTYNGGFFGWGQTTQIPTESSGSGIIIGENDTELLIVTNYHVVSDSTELSVYFSFEEAEEDEEQNVISAKIKGYDSQKEEKSARRGRVKGGRMIWQKLKSFMLRTDVK